MNTETQWERFSLHTEKGEGTWCHPKGVLAVNPSPLPSRESMTSAPPDLRRSTHLEAEDDTMATSKEGKVSSAIIVCMKESNGLDGGKWARVSGWGGRRGQKYGVNEDTWWGRL